MKRVEVIVRLPWDFQKTTTSWQQAGYKQANNSRQAVPPWRLLFSRRPEDLSTSNPIPEFYIPGRAAIFNNILDNKRHLVAFGMANIHTHHIALAIHQNEIIFGDIGRDHRVRFPGGRDESLGRQMLRFI